MKDVTEQTTNDISTKLYEMLADESENIAPMSQADIEARAEALWNE